jgi:hypothetical protein
LRGELRLWGQRSSAGLVRATEPAVRSKGTLYLALHPQGTHAWGRWVGMSYDGQVISGSGAIARTDEHVRQVVSDLIESERS